MLMSNVKTFFKRFKYSIPYLVLILIIVSGYYICPFKYVFGIDCPGCGMTRAFVSCLQFDFAAAFKHHPLFLILGIETIYVVFHKQISSLIHPNKKAELIIGIVSILLLLIVWIIRQFIIKI